MQRRLQPAACPYFALVAEAVGVAPCAALHQQSYCLFDLLLIRIALLNDGERDAVCAENYFRARGVDESRQRFIHLFRHSVEICGMPIKSLHAMNSDIVMEEPAPLIQARAGRG